MSLDIWTQCGAEANVGPRSWVAWRVVEGQHRVATLPLVDTLADQARLEQLIDSAKPPRSADPAFDNLHYLLSTPFRYPPLRHGSRFGTVDQLSIWYGALELDTALGEVAYYRLLFLEGTAADLREVRSEYTAFRVGVETPRGVDLTGPGFADFADALTDPAGYAAAQALGRAMRGAGVEAFCYASARRRGGRGVGLFTPRAFAARSPDPHVKTWKCLVTRGQVVFYRQGLTRPFDERRFDRAGFAVDGRLPAPAV